MQPVAAFFSHHNGGVGRDIQHHTLTAGAFTFGLFNDALAYHCAVAGLERNIHSISLHVVGHTDLKRYDIWLKIAGGVLPVDRYAVDSAADDTSHEAPRGASHVDYWLRDMEPGPAPPIRKAGFRCGG